jgi:hypothetical protein
VVAHFAVDLERDAIEQHAFDADPLARQRQPVVEAEGLGVRVGLVAHQEVALDASLDLDAGRFALILMGALNAVALVLLTRADALTLLPARDRYWMVGLFVAYIVMAVGFLMQAIEALRPGRFRPRIWDWNGVDDDRPIGVRYYEDVIKQSAAQHWKAWQEVKLTQLNAEIAVQVHSLSLKNHAKHVAIRRLYGGLRLMALVLGALMIVFAWLVWTQPEPLRSVPIRVESGRSVPVPVPSIPTIP